MSRKKKENNIGRYTTVFMTCLLGVPTCAKILTGFECGDIRQAVICGMVLGVLHLAARPIIRIVSIPVGCLTLGLIHPVIDVGLLYFASRLVEGFSITSPVSAVLCALMINIICFVVAGRK